MKLGGRLGTFVIFAPPQANLADNIHWRGHRSDPLFQSDVERGDSLLPSISKSSMRSISSPTASILCTYLSYLSILHQMRGVLWLDLRVCCQDGSFHVPIRSTERAIC
jgi:hypothetical protein